MKLKLDRIETPFVFELTNEGGSRCLIDASEAIGGKNKGFRPMELLAGSLAGCAAIDVLNVLSKKRIVVEHFSLQIEAERTAATPSPFQSICLVFKIPSEIDRNQVNGIIELVLQKYCSVSATLSDTVEITYKVE